MPPLGGQLNARMSAVLVASFGWSGPSARTRFPSSSVVGGLMELPSVENSETPSPHDTNESLGVSGEELFRAFLPCATCVLACTYCSFARLQPKHQAGT